MIGHMDFGGVVETLSVVKCPSCGRFCREGWLGRSTSPDGWLFLIGGICKKHGEWTDYAEETGWFKE